MQVPFIKMHGAGNDFVVVDCRAHDFNFSSFEIEEICNRHIGIGCDQLVLIKHSNVADCRVEFYNGDGSVSGTCGNASRCIAYLMMLQNDSESARLETGGGILECYASSDLLYTVNMGKARYGWQDIPLAREMDTLNIGALGIWDLGLENTPIHNSQSPSCVSMGNPHCVFFVDDVAAIDLAKYGPALENNEIFPQRANIGVAQVISKNEIKLRVWERGSGETLACGSGACAAVAAGVRRKILANKVMVHLPGGILNIEIAESGEIMMTGPVAIAFTGFLEI